MAISNPVGWQLVDSWLAVHCLGGLRLGVAVLLLCVGSRECIFVWLFVVWSSEELLLHCPRPHPRPYVNKCGCHGWPVGGHM